MSERYYMSTPKYVFHEDHVRDSHLGGVPSTFRPVVVIDPEDREQVERLRDLVNEYCGCGPSADEFVGILREFANPGPPKPDEPKRLGAVVKDARGRKWINVRDYDLAHAHEKPWCWVADMDECSDYADLDVVEVLS